MKNVLICIVAVTGLAFWVWAELTAPSAGCQAAMDKYDAVVAGYWAANTDKAKTALYAEALSALAISKAMCQ